MVAVVNLLAAGGGAVMVLFAQEKLGVDAVGFGLLFSGSAVGGVLGSLVAARVTRPWGTARVVVWTMVASALAYLVFGLSSDPWLAGVMFGLVGFLTVVFNVILGSLRQASPRLAPGPVISAFRLFSYGAVPSARCSASWPGRSGSSAVRGCRRGHPPDYVLCLPAVNTRTIAEARAAAPARSRVPSPLHPFGGVDPDQGPGCWPAPGGVASTSHQRAPERAVVVAEDPAPSA